jgi:hypothetical protein
MLEGNLDMRKKDENLSKLMIGGEEVTRKEEEEDTLRDRREKGEV